MARFIITQKQVIALDLLTIGINNKFSHLSAPYSTFFLSSQQTHF